jgi:hypothetical protein
MSIMKKVWVYKRTGIKGWWVGWYESGNRKAKALLTKALAEHYCQLKYSQLNSDVFTGVEGTYSAWVGHSKYLVESMEVVVVDGMTTDVDPVILDFAGQKEGPDLNDDGSVGFGDVKVFASQWRQSPGSPSADIAEPLDSFVDWKDLDILAEHWLEVTLWPSE